MKHAHLAAALVVIASALPVGAAVRYVDLNCTNATPPFTNWATAATIIQDAVDVANAGDEIVVTNGVYNTGGRAVNGILPNRLAVDKALTVRSVNGPSVTFVSGASPVGVSAVRCVYLASGALLTGFSLTNGATLSSGEASGGGAWCESSSAVLSNCVIAGNSAADDGGGVAGGTLNSCVPAGNSAAYDGGGVAGGTLNNCILSNNSALYGNGGGAAGCTLSNSTLLANVGNLNGGGVYNSTLNGCILTGNTNTNPSGATGGGGAFGGTLNNCTLRGNSTRGLGGGARESTLNNCTITGNSGSAGGAYGGRLRNCIVYYNTPQDYSEARLDNCCTAQLPPAGAGNFTSAPLFTDYAAGNLRLKQNSPCVNAGENSYAVGTTDLDGKPRIAGGTVDVGAYEYQGLTLNVTATAGGSVARSPDLPAYWVGSSVTITATAQVGSGFIRWTGDASGTNNPLAVLMDTNKNITAVFASTALTLASQGSGTISKVPDQPYYAVGDPVELTATAGRWHAFTGWTDGTNSNPRTVTISESNAYTAVFARTTPLETVTIGGVSRLAPVGMPAVVVDGNFILAGSVSARGSALVELSTTLPAGTLLYTLDGSDPSLGGALYAGPFTVRHTALLRAVAYSADFAQAVPGDPLSITILPALKATTDGGGSVAIDPPAGDYFSNSVAVLTATPAAGWAFLQWLGDVDGTNPVVALSMTRSKTAQAVFGTALTANTVGNGSLVISPVAPLYPCGTQVRLTPVPAAGNYHALWGGAASGRTNNPLVFGVTNANQTVTAVFASLGSPQTNALTVIADGRGQVALLPPGHRYRVNTSVTLQANAESGQEFLGWSGDASGTQNPLTVTMNASKVITARFTKRPWLRVEATPEMLREDGCRLTVYGEFGAVYQLFGTAHWAGWASLGTVSNASGTVQFTDPTATNCPARFYRASGSE